MCGNDLDLPVCDNGGDGDQPVQQRVQNTPGTSLGQSPGTQMDLLCIAHAS